MQHPTLYLSYQSWMQKSAMAAYFWFLLTGSCNMELIMRFKIGLAEQKHKSWKKCLKNFFTQFVQMMMVDIQIQRMCCATNLSKKVKSNTAAEGDINRVTGDLLTAIPFLLLEAIHLKKVDTLPIFPRLSFLVGTHGWDCIVILVDPVSSARKKDGRSCHLQGFQFHVRRPHHSNIPKSLSGWERKLCGLSHILSAVK